MNYFKSGYAGVPYDPEQLIEEVIDERVFKINELGQLELLYDPDIEIIQGKRYTRFCRHN